MQILVTGSYGFIGKNLVVRLGERADTVVLQFGRSDDVSALRGLVERADAIVHLAGENRPKNPEDFAVVNVDLTRALCDAIRSTGRMIPLVVASSRQAELDNPYGQSKRAAEQIVEQLTGETGNPAVIYRLPGVFGKWCKPNYNSVVATFCHNIANRLPINISDPSLPVRLVYVDDVISGILRSLEYAHQGLTWGAIEPEYMITLGDLADQIRGFKNSRNSLVTERVGCGLTRALYSTYVSYLPASEFSYSLPRYGDERGVFVEMLKTPDCGQFSFFTAGPEVTRGGHYHHTKTEKFLVISGTARFRFRNIVSDEVFEIYTSGEDSRVVDTVPGWTHDITNVGDGELIVMLWANEIFDRERPDTITSKV